MQPDTQLALLTSLEQFMGWLADGTLVRDISRDAAADWAPRMMEFVQALNRANAAVLQARAEVNG